MKIGIRPSFSLRSGSILLLIPLFAYLTDAGERAARGYLAAPSRSISALRFAPPPKPPVAALPPVAITGSPDLVLVSDFAKPPSAMIEEETERTSLPVSKGGLLMLPQEKTPVASPPNDVIVAVRKAAPKPVSPEMLLKFFTRTNIDVANGSSDEDTNMPFRVPLATDPIAGDRAD